MRWDSQRLDESADDGVLPGLGAGAIPGLVRSVAPPEFAGITFHEVRARSALNRVPPGPMPFEWTVNPYRGCSHACVYCLVPETPVLLADGRARAIGELVEGDRVIGTERVGRYRRLVETEVRAAWRTVKPAYEVALADGTVLVASGDHRFLSHRGWKHVTGSMAGRDRRPHLTTNDELLGLGRFAAGPVIDADYRRGYLTGLIRGDGHLGTYSYARPGRSAPDVHHRFRLALTDREPLERARDFLALAGVATTCFDFSAAFGRRQPLAAIRASSQAAVGSVRDIVRWPTSPTESWHRGFLAGIFDAEGSNSRGIIRIANCDHEIILRTTQSMRSLGIRSTIDRTGRDNQLAYVRIVGGPPMRTRFLHAVAPATTRKLAVSGTAIKSDVDLRVVEVRPLGVDLPMVDITTGTGDFIADGVVSHNCFARGSHAWLELDTGTGFDREIVVKVNIVEVLQRELAKPSWAHGQVALGTNTDPYQRAEGRYRLMPGIITALAGSGTPLSILTKGPLLRRDLPLVAAAARDVPAWVGVSIAILNEDLHHRLEPGTPGPRGRLDLVRAVRDHGLSCRVMLAPVLPWLTDGEDELDRALGSIAAAGATGATVMALHLKPATKRWFMAWLERERPDLVKRYQGLYGNGTYVPKSYRDRLAARAAPLLRKHGLTRTGGSPTVSAHQESVRPAAARPTPEPSDEQLRLV